MIEQSTPVAYEIDESGHKSKININYQKIGEEISFHLPDGYDHSKSLYIDPSLTFSTFSGSESDNWGFTATPDPYGNLFGGGIVMGIDYPVTNGAFDISYASVDPIWTFNGQKVTPPNPEKIKASVAKIGFKKVQINPKENSIYLPEKGMKLGLV